MVDIIEKVRDAVVVRRKVGCGIRRTARGRRVRRVRRIGVWVIEFVLGHAKVLVVGIYIYL